MEGIDGKRQIIFGQFCGCRVNPPFPFLNSLKLKMHFSPKMAIAFGGQFPFALLLAVLIGSLQALPVHQTQNPSFRQIFAQPNAALGPIKHVDHCPPCPVQRSCPPPQSCPSPSPSNAALAPPVAMVVSVPSSIKVKQFSTVVTDRGERCCCCCKPCCCCCCKPCCCCCCKPCCCCCCKPCCCCCCKPCCCCCCKPCCCCCCKPCCCCCCKPCCCCCGRRRRWRPLPGQMRNPIVNRVAQPTTQLVATPIILPNPLE